MTDLMKWFDSRRSPMDVIERLFEGEMGTSAIRQEKKEHKDKGGYRSEFRYGSFVRRVPLPSGVQQGDVTASYKDGVLEVRAPLPDQGQEAAASKIPITRG